MRVMTLVRFRRDLPRAQAWALWQQHTQEWDARDHPEILRTDFTLFGNLGGEAPGYDGMAVTHWIDEAAFRAAAAWYQTPASAAHAADLARFLDFDAMLTLAIADTASIAAVPA